MVAMKEQHRRTLQQLRDDACQLFEDLNSDMEQLRANVYDVAEEARAASERVHRQLTDAWQDNNRQVMKVQAATKRELTYRSGVKKIRSQLVSLRGEQAIISNQLRHDTMQAAGMVSPTNAHIAAALSPQLNPRLPYCLCWSDPFPVCCVLCSSILCAPQCSS